ncbi:MAG: acyltransferase [Comamonadaceae bacterium]|nr:MAG: acyltransferase [Comamonadaceae bacterium]
MKTDNIDALTGIRGIAAWMVVVYHFRTLMPAADSSNVLRLFDHGYLAVDLFFILSGLVLYINYHRKFEQLRLDEAVSFLLKRIARIYPLHLAILLLFIVNPVAILLFSSAGELGSRYSIEYFVMSLFLVQNWGFTPWVEWNIPAWSISTEFAAYLLFPLLVLGVKRGAGLGRWLLPSLYLLLLLGVAALYGLTGQASLDHSISRLGIARCLLEFTMGLILGHYLSAHAQQVQRQATRAFVLFGLLLAGTVLAAPVPDFLFAPTLFTLLIVSLLDKRTLWSRVLASRPLVFLGEISYSTYMIHYFVKDWIKFLSDGIGAAEFAVYVTVVFVASIALYRLIELPFRSRLYERFSRFSGRSSLAQ